MLFHAFYFHSFFVLSTGAEYDTIKELVENLKEGTTDAILLDMYATVTRRDLFNGSWFEVVQIVENEISHGLILSGEAVALAKDFEEMIRVKNVQTNFLTHSDEDEEEQMVSLQFKIMPYY